MNTYMVMKILHVNDFGWQHLNFSGPSSFAEGYKRLILLQIEKDIEKIEKRLITGHIPEALFITISSLANKRLVLDVCCDKVMLE